MSDIPSNVELRVREVETHLGATALVEVTIHDGVTTPDEFARASAKLDLLPMRPGQGVIVSGRGPIWGYGMLLHELHPFAWVGVYDPRMCAAVVVQSHLPGLAMGELVPMEAGRENR